MGAINRYFRKQENAFQKVHTSLASLAIMYAHLETFAFFFHKYITKYVLLFKVENAFSSP